MSKPFTEVGRLVVGAIIQALENDPSRTALSNDEAMRASGVFGGAPPAPYTLRQAMLHRPDLLDGLKRVNAEIAKHVYPLERWYIIDATYLKSPYYQKQILVRPAGGSPMYIPSKTTKVFVFRGRDTGVVVAVVVADENVSDQTVFEPMFKTLMAQGAIIRGGGILADAGFNKREFYDMVKEEGGQAFLDFDSAAKPTSAGRFSHYNEQLRLYKENRDQWHAFFDFRPLIEQTNHSMKSIKRIIRAKNELSREAEVLALVAGYSLSRLPELRLKYKLDLPFVDEAAVRYIDDAITKKRQRAAIGSVEIAVEREVADRPIFMPRRGWLLAQLADF
jgi:hypothetical protein